MNMITRRSLLAAVVAASMTLVACGDGDSSADDTGAGGSTPAGDGGELRSDVSRAPADPAAPVDVVVRGANNAGFELARQLATGGNLVLSPTSIATAFGMVAVGADDPTRAQLDDVFGFPAADALPAAMNTWGAALVPDGAADIASTFELANRIWVQDGAEIGQPFLDTLAADYGAGVATADFADQEATRQAINGWIADQTHDRIPELIAAPGYDPATVTVLVNAAYFKGRWQSPFDESATAPAPFARLDGTTVEVPMMRQELHAAAVLDEDAVAVRLPYDDGEFAMTIVMPDDLAAFLADLDGERWAMLDSVATDQLVRLSLPKWETELTARLEAPLTAMGLTIPGGSYPGITDGATVDGVIHGSNITVDEVGTEAAAATAIGVAAAAPAPQDPIEITFDHPFVYAITHVPTGSLLFVGVETDPSA